MRFPGPSCRMPLRLLAVLMLVGLTMACNAGQAEQRVGTAAEAPAARATLPMAAPAELTAPATASAATPLPPGPDKGRSCSTDADCMVKDVGSCCGYRPQCLNKDTPTFPEQVKAKCAREGRVSACGVLAVSGCQCVSGKCENLLQSDQSLPAAPAPLQ